MRGTLFQLVGTFIYGSWRFFWYIQHLLGVFWWFSTMCIKMGTFLGWNHIKGNLVPYKLFLVSTYSCFTSQPWITSSKRFSKFSAISFLFYFILVSKFGICSNQYCTTWHRLQVLLLQTLRVSNLAMYIHLSTKLGVRTSTNFDLKLFQQYYNCGTYVQYILPSTFYK